jgi:diguanylate cyclase (GGDEF)-like protein
MGIGGSELRVGTSGERKPIQLSSSIRLGITTLVLIAMAAMCYDILQLTRAVDRRALEQETARLRSAIHIMGEATASEHLLIAGSPETSAQVRSSSDSSWFARNFWPFAVFDHAEYGMIIDPADGGVLAHSTEGGEMDPALLTSVLTRIARKDRTPDNQAATFLPGAHGHEIMIVRGKPAQVVTITIAPVHMAIDSEGRSPPVLVHVTPIDDRVVRRLADIALLPGLALLDHASASESGRGVLPLIDNAVSGFPVLVWKSELPGGTVLRALLPALLLPALAILFYAADLTRKLVRMAKQLQQQEADAVRVARTDYLTGLSNRRWFYDKLILDIAAHSAGDFGVALIDVDYFKSVNDTFGHAAGDAVLCAFAQRLSSASLGPVFAARIGGDEFALVITGADNRERLAEFCDALVKTLTLPVAFEGREISVGTSVGAALWPSDGKGIDDILAAADIALYRAKRDGRGCARTFDAEQDLVQALRGMVEDAANQRHTRAVVPVAA